MLTIRPQPLRVHVRQRRGGSAGTAPPPSPAGCTRSARWGTPAPARRAATRRCSPRCPRPRRAGPPPSGSARSMPSARPPASAATALAASTLRSTTSTAAPAAASRRAQARPMPLPPPVTRALRPERSTCTTWGTATGSAVMAHEVTRLCGPAAHGAATHTRRLFCVWLRADRSRPSAAAGVSRPAGCRSATGRVSNTRTAGARGGGGVRVLGVDPGLTRCGVGVVEGVPGRPCTLVAYYVVRTDPDDELPLRLLHLDRSLTDLVAEHRPDAVAVERVFSQHNVRTVMGTAQASGDRRARRGAGRAARADVHPERGQGGGDRVRSGRQGADDHDGDPAAAAGRAAPARPTPPTRWPWPSATSGAAAPGPSWPPRPQRARRGGCDDRQRARHGDRDRSGPRGGGGGRHRPGGAVRPRHPRRPAGRSARPARHQPGRPGGLAHPLRLRRRRRQAALRAAPDRQRGGPPAGPGGARRAHARTRCARPSPTPTPPR